jgi:hypothetical protein
MKMLYYREIDEHDEPVDVYILPEEAIRTLKETAKSYGIEYENDDEILQDFIALNWAVWVDKPE